jgi:hypothetical protein
VTQNSPEKRIWGDWLIEIEIEFQFQFGILPQFGVYVSVMFVTGWIEH